MFAIISHKNNQYKVSVDSVLDLPMTEYDKKDNKIVFESVLLVADGDNITVGKPEVAGAKVIAEVIEEYKTKKIKVFKFHSKKHYTRTAGHRSLALKVKIKQIETK